MTHDPTSTRSTIIDGTGQSSAEDERDLLLARLELAQAAGGIGIHDYDIINDRIEWDARVRHLWGMSLDEPVTYATFAAGVHADDLAAVEQAVAVATDPAGDGRYLARYRVKSRNGAQYHVEATGRTHFVDGRAVRLVGTIRDITGEVTAARELAEARNFAENLIQSAPTLLYIYDLVQKRNLYIGPQIARMTDLTASDYAKLGDALLPTMIHPDDLDRVAAHHHAIREGVTAPPFQIEYRLLRKDGSWLWLSSTEVVHARGDDGRPTQLLGASLDITRRYEAEALRELLIGEMAHRIKNLLSVVQSIGALTIRNGCNPDIWLAYEQRMGALGAAQRLLTDGDWRSADLSDVVRAVLAPFDDATEARIELVGPTLDVDGGHVTTVALALHELATNAVKHGALSVPGGHVRVCWRREDDDIVMEWTEQGGPPVTPPQRLGFGSMMIEALGSADGEKKMNFRPEGLHCRFTL